MDRDLDNFNPCRDRPETELSAVLKQVIDLILMCLLRIDKERMIVILKILAIFMINLKTGGMTRIGETIKDQSSKSLLVC